jgi:hypothetical protein
MLELTTLVLTSLLLQPRAGGDEVGVLGVAADEVGYERAERDERESTRSQVVERALHESAAEAVSLDVHGSSSAGPLCLDTFAKIDGSWYFAERKLLLDWSETRPSNPEI